ncbi:MAG: gamma-glutamyl-gamma-aminobutyrate hydrolase family protein [Woeseiaceae bacterium]|nr:gamma-glutamyl-gamma-aminobutyrate hydrolase family protein [Woeseiaceae bacterium]
MTTKPLIAVPSDRRILDPHPSHVAGEKYLKALIDGAGGLPVIVPSMAGDIAIDEILDRVDGILLTGSYSNIEPHRYGGETTEKSGLFDPHRDAMTLPLALRALERGVPLLAVCRGHQELNVALGGTLHQNMADVPGYHDHLENKQDPLDKQYGPSHPVSLVDGGLLRQLAGSDSVMVNSLHAQGVDRLAGGVTVEAVADDGLVEAFRIDTAPGFNLSVQWHPEWRVTENNFSMAIFKAFGDACRARAKQRQV